MSDKIKRIINCGLPVNICNFRCHYCYVGQTSGYSNENPDLPYPMEVVKKALSQKRTGGVCLINLCGAGETMLGTYIIELTRALLEEGHYVTLVTNGSMGHQYDELLKMPNDLLCRLFIKFSFHYLELKRLGMLRLFFDNVKKIQEKEVSFTVELTANDESIPYISDIKKICQKELGALCHIIESRDDTSADLRRMTNLSEKQHLDAWESFDSALIRFQKTTWGVHRSEFCYAGDWLWNVDLWTGNITICLKHGKSIGNIYEGMDEAIHAAAIGKNCPWPHCFSSYFLMTNGVIPEIDTPCYGELRDRVCEDGTHWLQPEVFDFFHSKLAESNTIYTSDKKEYINALMSVVYGREDFAPDYFRLGQIITSNLRSKQMDCFIVLLDEDMEPQLLDFVLCIVNGLDIPVTYKWVDLQDSGALPSSEGRVAYIVVNYRLFGRYMDTFRETADLLIPVTELADPAAVTLQTHACRGYIQATAFANNKLADARFRRGAQMEPQRIIIKTEGEYNESASGSEIWIVGALVDDIWYSAEEIFDHTWIKKWRMLGWNSYTQDISNEVWGYLRPGERYACLVFEKNRWRGKCHIEFLGKQAELDCYGEVDGGLLYFEL